MGMGSLGGALPESLFYFNSIWGWASNALGDAVDCSFLSMQVFLYFLLPINRDRLCYWVISGGAVPASAFSNKKSFRLVGGKGAGNVLRTESVLPMR